MFAAHAPQQFTKAPALTVPLCVLTSTEPAWLVTREHFGFLLQIDTRRGRGQGKSYAEIPRIEARFLQPQAGTAIGCQPWNTLGGLVRADGIAGRGVGTMKLAAGPVRHKSGACAQADMCPESRSTSLMNSG